MTTKAPVLISIIIPTYNRGDCIERTILSVLKQHHKLFELIIVDDGSLDNTDKVVLSFKDERIRYFKKENAERGAARNYGIRLARGHYITFLDSDDLLKENHLTVANAFIDKNPNVEIFHLGYDVVSSSGLILYPWKRMPDPINKKLREGNFLSCLGIFIKREILQEIQFNENIELSGSEDYELWIRLAARYPIRTLSVSTANLVNHDFRSVLKIDVLKLKRRVHLFKYYISTDKKVCETYSSSDLNSMFAYMDLYAALHLSISGNKNVGWIFLFKGLRKYPYIMLNYRLWIVLKKLIAF